MSGSPTQRLLLTHDDQNKVTQPPLEQSPREATGKEVTDKIKLL